MRLVMEHLCKNTRLDLLLSYPLRHSRRLLQDHHNRRSYATTSRVYAQIWDCWVCSFRCPSRTTRARAPSESNDLLVHRQVPGDIGTFFEVEQGFASVTR